VQGISRDPRLFTNGMKFAEHVQVPAVSRNAQGPSPQHGQPQAM
jgi:hypothetical protein